MPGRTISDRKSFYNVYVLESGVDGNRYIGMTNDLRRRFQEHVSGKNTSTAYRRLLSLTYYEACLSKDDAIRREKYFKVTGGRRFLAKRLRCHISRRSPKLY